MPKKKTGRISPESLAREIKSWLEKHRNPRIAAQSQKYFKDYDEVRFYGIATPEIRAFSAELWERVNGEWRVADAVRLAELMLPDTYHEIKGLAVLILLRHGPKIPRTTLRYAIERFSQAKRRRLLEATKG